MTFLDTYTVIFVLFSIQCLCLIISLSLIPALGEVTYVVHFNDPDVYSKEKGLMSGKKKGKGTVLALTIRIMYTFKSKATYICFSSKRKFC
jgi:hypothetical protein